MTDSQFIPDPVRFGDGLVAGGAGTLFLLSFTDIDPMAIAAGMLLFGVGFVVVGTIGGDSGD